MRVTQSMLNSQLIGNLSTNLDNLENLQNQMSTGKRINRPSDDPVGMSFSLRYRNALEENDQFQRNTDSAISWVDNTEQMVKETNDILQRVRELAVKGANGTLSDEAMESIASEVEQLYDHLVSIGNNKFNGKYTFNGQMTDIIPYYPPSNAMNVNTNMREIRLETSIGVTIPINISGSELFGDSADSTNAFKALDDLKNALNNHDSVAVEGSIGVIDDRLDIVAHKWSEVGAIANRLDLTKNRLEDESVNLQKLISDVEDADMAEVYVNYQNASNVYEASLSTGAKIIQPSLVDFLK